MVKKSTLAHNFYLYRASNGEFSIDFKKFSVVPEFAINFVFYKRALYI